MFVLLSVYKTFLQTKLQKASIEAKSHFKSDLKHSAFLEMLTKSVAMRTITATRAGCVQRGLDQKTLISGRGSRNVIARPAGLGPATTVINISAFIFWSKSCFTCSCNGMHFVTYNWWRFSCVYTRNFAVNLHWPVFRLCVFIAKLGFAICQLVHAFQCVSSLPGCDIQKFFSTSFKTLFFPKLMRYKKWVYVFLCAEFRNLLHHTELGNCLNNVVILRVEVTQGFS